MLRCQYLSDRPSPHSGVLRASGIDPLVCTSHEQFIQVSIKVYQVTVICFTTASDTFHILPRGVGGGFGTAETMDVFKHLHTLLKISKIQKMAHIRR
jgi:hypothetical protein